MTLTHPKAPSVEVLAVTPDQVRCKDCICSVDTPDGRHEEYPGRPEVLAVAHVRGNVVIGYLDRDAEAIPSGTTLMIYRKRH